MTGFRPQDRRVTAPQEAVRKVAVRKVAVRSRVADSRIWSRNRNTRGLFLLLACLLAIGLLAGQSTPVNAQTQQRANVQSISSGQAANIARRSVGGKVLSVRPTGKHFRVKLLKRNGVVTQVRVHRTNGRVSR